jgi:acyl-CoA hydrolase
VTSQFDRVRDRHRGSAPDLTPRPASQSQTTIIEVMEVIHANNAGNVHGGTIMRLVDTCTGMAAARHSRQRVVTVSMDEMSFLQPVYIGDLLHVKATVNEAFGSSMEVGARVDVEPLDGSPYRHVARAYLVFVALDQEGKPARVAPVIAETPDEKRRQAQAHIRRESRLLRKAALLRSLQEDDAAGHG